MATDNNLDTLLQDANPEFSRAGPFYCDDEIFQIDLDRIVTQKWLLVDHVSRIPQRGQYFVYNIGSESIIVVRENENTINAFFNVCRHRGSIICDQEEGKRNVLTCPYHAWTYNLDGSLKAARLMPDDFEPADNGLFPCHIRVWHGFIFLNLTKNTPPDFDSEFSQLEPWVEFYGFRDAKIVKRAPYPTKANWKLVVENFLECYHCIPSHPEFSSINDKEALVALGAGPGSGPKDMAYEATYSAWEAEAATLGRPKGSVDDGENSSHMKFCQQRPLKNGILSETRDGQPVTCPLGGGAESDRGRMHLSFGPLNHIIACNDFAAVIRFTPENATLTTVDVCWLVDQMAENVDIERLTWLWDTTTKQDKTIAENNQRGVMSTRYTPGRYSNQERKVMTFNRWYLRQLASLDN